MANDNRPSWWTLTKGASVKWQHSKFNDGKPLQCRVASVGNNRGTETVVKILVPGVLKARSVRMKELNW